MRFLALLLLLLGTVFCYSEEILTIKELIALYEDKIAILEGLDSSETLETDHLKYYSNLQTTVDDFLIAGDGSLTAVRQIPSLTHQQQT